MRQGGMVGYMGWTWNCSLPVSLHRYIILSEILTILTCVLLHLFGCHENQPLGVTLLALGITSHGGWVAACWQP